MLKLLITVGLFFTSITVGEANDNYPNRDSIEASQYRGEIVFQNYCTLCHGITADGSGRAAKMYTPKPSNLRQTQMPRAYLEQMIRKGGKANGRSEFMPPWQEELTEEQITDVLNFLETINENKQTSK